MTTEPTPIRYLKLSDGPLANVRLWFDMVEEQTKEKFQIRGAALCVGEELGELEEAMVLRDKEAVADALGDITVASYALEFCLRREFPSTQREDVRLSLLPISDHAGISALVAGQMCELARKGTEKRGPVHYLETCFQVRRFVERLAHDQGIDFAEAIAGVMRTLDGRLVAGYKMKDGSAIKQADQVAT